MFINNISTKLSIRKKILVFGLGVFLVFSFFYFLNPRVENYTRWNRTAEAVGGFPYEIGLTGVAVIPCLTSGVPPVCFGGVLCATLDPARCNLYSDVSGTPAGGAGTNALFLKASLTQAGVIPGGQLIAGGMSPVFMDSGVLAGMIGCVGVGCIANKENESRYAIINNTRSWIDAVKFIIAGKKE